MENTYSGNGIFQIIKLILYSSQFSRKTTETWHREISRMERWVLIDNSHLLSAIRDKNQEEFIYAAYIMCDYQTNRCAWYRKWWHECRRHECWINSNITRLMSLIIVSSTDFEDTSTQTKPWSLKSSICPKNFKFAADIYPLACLLFCNFYSIGIGFHCQIL